MSRKNSLFSGESTLVRVENRLLSVEKQLKTLNTLNQNYISSQDYFKSKELQPICSHLPAIPFINIVETVCSEQDEVLYYQTKPTTAPRSQTLDSVEGSNSFAAGKKRRAVSVEVEQNQTEGEENGFNVDERQLLDLKTIPEEICALTLIMRCDFSYKPQQNDAVSEYWLLQNMHKNVAAVQEDIKKHKLQFLAQLSMELRANRAQKKNIFADQTHNWYDWLHDSIQKHFDPLLNVHIQQHTQPFQQYYSDDLSISPGYVETLVNFLKANTSQSNQSSQSNQFTQLAYVQSLHPFIVYCMQLSAVFIYNIHFEEVVDDYKRRKPTNILSEAKERKIKLMVYKYMILLQLDCLYRLHFSKNDDSWKVKMKQFFQHYTAWFDFNKSVTKTMQNYLNTYITGNV